MINLNQHFETILANLNLLLAYLISHYLIKINEFFSRFPDYKVTLEFAETKNVFVVRIEKIVIIIHEIIVYIEQACEECKDNPTDFLIKIEVPILPNMTLIFWPSD